MVERILVPIDGSDPADAAVEYALEQFPESHIILYHAVNPFNVAQESTAEEFRSEFWEEKIEEARDESEEILSAAEREVDGEPAEVELESEVGPAVHSIVSYLDRRDVDQIVIGSHGRTGVGRVALGSVAEKVARRASVPVTIVNG